MGAEKGFSFLQLEKKANKWFGVHESFRNANRAIHVLNDQELLTAEEYGIRKYNLQNRQFAALVTEIKDAKISRFVKTSRGDFWAISERGLLKIDEEGTLLTRYHTASSDFPLNSDIIYDLLEDEQGQLWVGTAGGLHLLNLENFTLKTFTKQDGLPDNRVCGILEDQKGNLWLSTFHGLSQFNPDTERFINYFEEDGLPNNEFNRCSKLQTSDGLFIFGGIEGFTTFYPEKVTNSKENKSTLLLTKLSTYDAGAPKMIHTATNLEDLKQISLSPNNKFFRLEFALLDFFSSKQHSYQWYLEGFENDWQVVSSNNFVQYNNIPAGDYTFRLKAADARGNWNDQQIAIQVSVKQFFYKTWWFISLLLLSLLGIVFAIYHYRVQQILQIERLLIKIASDLHDEVGSLMTKISVGADMIKAKMYEEKEEEEALEKIAAQSRAATSTMSDVIWSIDARKDQLGDLLDRMKEHCEELLTPAQINYEFKATDLSSHQKIDLLLRQNLYLIFKEAINNIVKHSNATQVDIALSNTPHFEMRIQDNGTTISQKGKTGQGLVNMRMRAERIGGELRIRKDHGFCVLLIVSRL